MAHPASPFSGISTYDKKSGNTNVIVTTPQGGRNYYTCDPATGIFTLSGVLPNTLFPFSLGIVPGTVTNDGVPVQVVLLSDEAAFPGCVLQARLLGTISEDLPEGATDPMKHQRIVAACALSPTWLAVKKLQELDPATLDAIELFLIEHGNFTGIPFTPAKQHLVASAISVIADGQTRLKKLPISFRFRWPGGRRGGKKDEGT